MCTTESQLPDRPHVTSVSSSFVRIPIRRLHCTICLLLLQPSQTGAVCTSWRPPQRIAIVGGGLAGLATAVELLELDPSITTLHIFDPCLPGTGGASAVAAGLLHPFTPRGTEIWAGRTGFAAALSLIRRAEASGEHVSRGGGLLRLAFDPEQAALLQEASASNGEGALEQRWVSHTEACERAGSEVGDGALGATFAPAAVSVDTPSYLRALWAICEAAGAEWRLQSVHSLSSLQSAAVAEGGQPYDAIVVAAGSRTPQVSLHVRLSSFSSVRIMLRSYLGTIQPQ